MLPHKKISILGAGGWGTALSIWLHSNQQAPIYLWGHNPQHVEALLQTRQNETYLPGITLPDSIHPTNDLKDLADSSLIIFVTPSRALEEVAIQLSKAAPPSSNVPLLNCTKGIEHRTGRRMSGILHDIFSANPIAALSGPSHAEEVARGTPTAVVLGSEDFALSRNLQGLFNTSTYRAYTSNDIAGVELGGALKNVFAIAAGISDGLGLGDNAKAALVTRALAEMIRLGVKMGGRRETFQGLSGIGDLMVTCFSKHSRNRGVGERLGKGEALDRITASMKMVAEGIPTAKSAYDWARHHEVETPIINQVYAILYEHRPPKIALKELLLRDPRTEVDDQGK